LGLTPLYGRQPWTAHWLQSEGKGAGIFRSSGDTGTSGPCHESGDLSDHFKASLSESRGGGSAAVFCTVQKVIDYLDVTPY